MHEIIKKDFVQNKIILRNIKDQPTPRPSNRNEEEKNEYYHTAETCTDIQFSDLQGIVREKNEGQLNIFHKEYKVTNTR